MRYRHHVISPFVENVDDVMADPPGRPGNRDFV
jgi:hypothetical protein